MSDQRAATMPDPLRVGDPFPWVKQRSAGLPTFALGTAAGRYLVLCFYGSAAQPRAITALAAAARHRSLFDGQRAWFFGVSHDPADEAQARVRESNPGVTFLWDFDRSVARACGAAPKEGGAPADDRQMWMVVDPTLHVLAVFPFEDDPASHDRVFRFVEGLRPPRRFAGFEMPIPVLVLPNVLERDLCHRLIDLYDRDGGSESGIFRDGTGVQDHSFKRRKDYTIGDPALVRTLQSRIHRRVVPEIEKLFFMTITRMERYIVGCYAAEDGGVFRPHRDNGPGATAHRRYAVSINLNADFEGGEVSFPEYSDRALKAPPGWAVVFPAAILHSVSMVTRGRRYAFLPFVYDEGGARIREAHLASMAAPAPAAAE